LIGACAGAVCLTIATIFIVHSGRKKRQRGENVEEEEENCNDEHKEPFLTRIFTAMKGYVDRE